MPNGFRAPAPGQRYSNRTTVMCCRAPRMPKGADDPRLNDSFAVSGLRLDDVNLRSGLRWFPDEDPVG